MIRTLAILGAAAFIAAIALIVGTDQIPLGIGLLLVSVAISAFLAAHRGFHLARNILRDASQFVSGDVQRARIVDVSDPKGIFFPKSTVAFELQGDDDTAVHRIEREVPIPPPAAWSYRLGKRFRIPFLRSLEPAELMAVCGGRDSRSPWRGDNSEGILGWRLRSPRVARRLDGKSGTPLGI